MTEAQITPTAPEPGLASQGMAGQWVKVWTREPLDTLEKAEAEFEKYNHYSSDYSDVQLVDEAGHVVKDWINGKYLELFGGQ